uniref:Uncharacterized protein n=1 Tax=Schizaphis graminum TaxID=13262 RepID=A0A2S2NF90_SCHGA
MIITIGDQTDWHLNGLIFHPLFVCFYYCSARVEGYSLCASRLYRQTISKIHGFLSDDSLTIAFHTTSSSKFLIRCRTMATKCPRRYLSETADTNARLYTCCQTTDSVDIRIVVTITGRKMKFRFYRCSHLLKMVASIVVRTVESPESNLGYPTTKYDYCCSMKPMVPQQSARGPGWVTQHATFSFCKTKLALMALKSILPPVSSSSSSTSVSSEH